MGGVSLAACLGTVAWPAVGTMGRAAQSEWGRFLSKTEQEQQCSVGRRGEPRAS